MPSSPLRDDPDEQKGDVVVSMFHHHALSGSVQPWLSLRRHSHMSSCREAAPAMSPQARQQSCGVVV